MPSQGLQAVWSEASLKKPTAHCEHPRSELGVATVDSNEPGPQTALYGMHTKFVCAFEYLPEAHDLQTRSVDRVPAVPSSCPGVLQTDHDLQAEPSEENFPKVHALQVRSVDRVPGRLSSCPGGQVDHGLHTVPSGENLPWVQVLQVRSVEVVPGTFSSWPMLQGVQLMQVCPLDEYLPVTQVLQTRSEVSVGAALSSCPATQVEGNLHKTPSAEKNPGLQSLQVRSVEAVGARFCSWPAVQALQGVHATTFVVVENPLTVVQDEQARSVDVEPVVEMYSPMLHVLQFAHVAWLLVVEKVPEKQAAHRRSEVDDPANETY